VLLPKLEERCGIPDFFDRAVFDVAVTHIALIVLITRIADSIEPHIHSVPQKGTW
jgi:hypothetical protein|tara:strand:- start:78 stop:242 length:165 start_codon:yes stop_codon:yes gene_type:complete